MRWTRRIALYLARHQSTTVEQLAQEFGISPARCREELEWMDGDVCELARDDRVQSFPGDHPWDHVFN